MTLLAPVTLLLRLGPPKDVKTGPRPVDPLLSPPKLLADLFAVGPRQQAMI